MNDIGFFDIFEDEMSIISNDLRKYLFDDKNLITIIDNLLIKLDGKYFSEIDEKEKHFDITHSARPKQFSVITKIDKNSGIKKE